MLVTVGTEPIAQAGGTSMHGRPVLGQLIEDELDSAETITRLQAYLDRGDFNRIEFSTDSVDLAIDYLQDRIELFDAVRNNPVEFLSFDEYRSILNDAF